MTLFQPLRPVAALSCARKLTGRRNSASPTSTPRSPRHRARPSDFGLRICLAAFLILGLAANTGCSLRRYAVNKVGDALAGGAGTFASDDDPELIKAAAPFSLKLMESLLEESPRHKGLLLATASGFTEYSYAFVQQEAEEIENQDIAASLEQRSRARRLYLRARGYALRGLETVHPGFTNQLRADPKAAVKTLSKKDVPLAYWAAASWAAAIGIIKNNTDLIAQLPQVEALADRALELDEAYDHGAIHSFLIAYDMTRPISPAEAAARARAHFERAVQLTGGQHAGPFISLAESVSVPQQNSKEFETLLKRALAIDADSKPEWRVANLALQRRARWLLSQTNNLIANDEK